MASDTDFDVLIVEDEKVVADMLCRLLQGEARVTAAGTGEEALNCIEAGEPDLVLLDIRLPGMDGMECLEKIKKLRPETEVAMVTATRDVRTAVRAMKLGACDYIEKPFRPEDLQNCVRRVRESTTLKRRLSILQEEVSRPYRFENIVGQTPVMKALLERVEKLARTDVPVLIVGESGTGKELVARAIHFNGNRRDGPFVAVNCAREGGGLVESEVFGHEKGAFTGAISARKGALELAHEGTLLLDEIGTMPPGTQAKLLRAIETKEFTRIGAEENTVVDIRVLSATNSDIDEAVKRGQFREDLFYRLNAARIRVPPLRERKDDIPLLVDHFIAKHSEKARSRVRRVSPETMEMLAAHAWAGNVRELENTARLLLTICDSEVVLPEDLDLPIVAPRETVPLRDARDCAEREKVLEALRANDWNQTRAAEALGVHRNTLRILTQKHSILPERAQ